MPRAVRLLVGLAIASSAILPGSLAAQAEFAVPVAPGQLRVDITPWWLSYDHYFDPAAPGTLVPLSAAYQADTFGVAALPFLAPSQTQIRAASGVGDFVLNLGATEVALTSSIRTIPIGFELGLSKWLAVGVSVPIVRSRVDVGFRTDSTRTGNVTWNPGYFNAGLDSAFRSQMNAALAALQTQATGGPAALRAQAQALLGTLQPFLAVSSAPFLPNGSTAAAAGITTRLDSAETAYAQLAAQYAAGGVTLPPLTELIAMPDSASVLTRDSLEQLFNDTRLPVQSDTFGTFVRTGLGDVTAHATLQLANRAGLRGQLVVTTRFPTGTAPSAYEIADLGTGTHEFGLDLALAGDVRLADRFLVHGVARAGGSGSDQLPMRVTPPDLPFAPVAQVATIKRSPGSYVGLDLDPVWMLDDAFSVRVVYRYFNQAATRHSYVTAGDSARVGLPAGVLDEGTAMQWMRIGGGVTFSTLDRYAKGLASLPYTLTVSYENTVWGRTGRVPQVGEFRITLRAYLNLFGQKAASQAETPPPASTPDSTGSQPPAPASSPPSPDRRTP